MLHSTEMLPVLRAHCRLLCGNAHHTHRVVAWAPLLARRRALHRFSSSATTEVADSLPAPAATGSQPLPPMSWEGRNSGCGSLSEDDIGSSFTLCGWVHRQRNLGGKESALSAKLSYQCVLQHDHFPKGGQQFHKAQPGCHARPDCVCMPAGLCFVDLRDASGIVQVMHVLSSNPSFCMQCPSSNVSGDPALCIIRHLNCPAGGPQIVSQEGASGLERVRAEYVVRVQGQLRKRIDPNLNIPTGMVELVAEQV